MSDQRQMLGTEPPHFAQFGSARSADGRSRAGAETPDGGALRDFVLGVKVMDGRGEVLSFGGRMKNVAATTCRA